MPKYRLFDSSRLLAASVLSAAVLAACSSTPEVVTQEPIPPPPAPAVVAAPPPVVLRDNAPLSYVVQPGDTLWSIANRFLLDPWQWPEVWIVNDQVANPHLIYPGDVLKLVWRDGSPQLTRVQPGVRSSELASAVPVIPVDVLRHFLRSPRVLSPEELASAPYVLAFDQGHRIGAAGAEAYIRQLPEQPEPTYTLVREGQRYVDPDDGRFLGIEAVPIGELEIIQPGDPAISVIIKSSREALAADRLVPSRELALGQQYLPHAPEMAVGGRILAVYDGITQIGQYQVVAINRGTQHGMEEGHVLKILQVGQMVADPVRGNGAPSVQIPDRVAGTALVFEVGERMSFALVMEAQRELHMLDKVESPLYLP